MLLHITELWEKNREQVTIEEAEQVMKTLQGSPPVGRRVNRVNWAGHP